MRRADGSSSWWYSRKALARAPLPKPPDPAAAKSEASAKGDAAPMAVLLPDGQKACGACTFYNASARTTCEVCGTALVLPAAEPPPPTGAAPGALRVGAAVLMRTGDASADWAGFWGASNYRLSFSVGARHTVAEVRGNFFRPTQYTTLWAPISATDFTPAAPAAAAASATASSDGSWALTFPSSNSTVNLAGGGATRMYQVMDPRIAPPRASPRARLSVLALNPLSHHAPTR